MEHKDRVGRIESGTGIGTEQKTARVRIRGAHGILREYTISAVSDEPAKVVNERVISPEEEARGRATPEVEARGRARSNLMHYVWWIGKHFADKYPTRRDRIEYARAHVRIDKSEGKLYDEIAAELLAEAT